MDVEWFTDKNMYKVFVYYGKHPKNLYTKVSDKMAYANNADPDQTAPSKAVWSRSTLFAVPLSILRNNYMKTKFRPKMYGNKVFEILGLLP